MIQTFCLCLKMALLEGKQGEEIGGWCFFPVLGVFKSKAATIPSEELAPKISRIVSLGETFSKPTVFCEAKRIRFWECIHHTTAIKLATGIKVDKSCPSHDICYLLLLAANDMKCSFQNTSQSSLVGDSNPSEKHSSNGMIFSNFNVETITLLEFFSWLNTSAFLPHPKTPCKMDP